LGLKRNLEKAVPALNWVANFQKKARTGRGGLFRRGEKNDEKEEKKSKCPSFDSVK